MEEIKWILGFEVPNDRPFRAIIQHWINKEILFETELEETDDGYYIHGQKPTEMSHSYNIIMWREI